MTTPNLPGYVDDASLGVSGYGAVVDYLLEQTPELLHPLSVRTFARMRHEPQLAAILRAYQLAIARGKWTVNGDGCRDEVTQRIADDLGLPVKGVDAEPTGARRRGFTWAEHLRITAGLSLAFGHAPFAQQWADEGGQYRLAMVQERMPQTIAYVHMNPDGTLQAAEQYGTLKQAKGPLIRTANHELVWYAREREGSNYYGRSLIRESYGPWLIKDQMLRVLATSHRRNGMGVWQVQAPSGAHPNQVLEAQRIAATTKAGEFAGIGLPSGFTAELKGMSGSLPDTLAFIQYLDRQMTRSTLTSILDMATAERGSRSLGETVMQLMIYAQQAEAQRIADDATTQMVIPLVDANWGADTAAPIVEVADVGADEQLTAQDLNWLLEYGGIRPDLPARAWIRQRYGLPEEDPSTNETEPDPADPNEPAEPPQQEGPPNA